MNCPNCSAELKPKTRYCPSCGTNVEIVTAGNLISDSDPKIAAFEKALGNKYRILRKVGSGGFADVYLGEHTQLGRNVAIKILRGSDDEEMIERFRREARAAAKLSHPNIIDIYDVGDNESIYYFVMKYIPGDTLAQKMRREKKITPGIAIEITKQVVDALAYAHDRGVVHRDIKPANVLIDEFGKPILMDFGIARLSFVGQLTRTGTLMGTPHYLPPEQPLGKPVDGRSDIYSLGIMFYEMLAGRVPFHDDAAIALIYKHINEQAPPLSKVAPELAPELAEVVHKMIEKLPENRHQSAHDLFDVLDSLSTIYPARVTPSRRSTPGIAKDTERLILLADEHQQQSKFAQALELYGTILQRSPDHKEALQKRDAVVELFLESIAKDISEKQFPKAWQSITQLQRFLSKDPRVSDLLAELEREEQAFNKESEFQSHFMAAQTALRHDNAGGAVEHLTKALTIAPNSEEARTLLRDARASYENNRRKAEFTNAFDEAEYHFNQQSLDEALSAVQRALKLDRNTQALELEDRIQAALKERSYRESEERNITKEVDHLCEELSFNDALKFLNSVKGESPALVNTLLPKVERSRDLYGKFVEAQERQEEGKKEEALKAIQEFLSYPLPYEFQAFYALRKQGEEILKANRLQQEEAGFEQLLKKADTFLGMGQIHQAREICSSILEKNPENSIAKKKLKEIDRLLGDTEIDTDELLKQIEMTSSQPPVIQPGLHSAETIHYAAEPQPSTQEAPPLPPYQPKPVFVPPAMDSQTRNTQSRQAAAAFGLTPFMAWGLGAAAALAILTMLLFVFWSPSEDPPARPVEDVKIDQPTVIKKTTPVNPAILPALSVSIDVRPWAEIEIKGKGLTQPMRGTTPVRLELPPGEYSVTFTNPNPDFTSFTRTIQVSNSNRNFRFEFQQLNTDQVVEKLLR